MRLFLFFAILELNSPDQSPDFIGLRIINVADLDNDGDEEVIWEATQGPLAFHENLSNTVSIGENIGNHDTNIRLYPNPARDFVDI